MHLLNSNTRNLEDVDLQATPRYAILSHRWEEEEVSFRDIRSPAGRRLKGYTKLVNCCLQAAGDGFSHVWIDTCCINKDSSAELSEAINSMFQWYRKSARCYVYLYDVETFAEFAKSSWFKRGWTLQELLAPSELHFYNKDWQFLFDKRDVLRELEFITSIPKAALQDFHSQDYYIAHKMSWSVDRLTTREEDQAYCLLGIFDINMPLIYGEGSRAFERLQEVIMENSIDMSLFAWQGMASQRFGMLAASPTCFTIEHPTYDLWTGSQRFNLSEGWNTNNAGISIRLDLAPHSIDEEGSSVFLAKLHQPGEKKGIEIGIFLQRIGPNLFRRVLVDDQAAAVLPTDFYHSPTHTKYTVRKVMIARSPIAYAISTGYHKFNVIDRYRSTHLVRFGRPSYASRTSCSSWPITPYFVYQRTHAYGILGYVSVEYRKDAELGFFFGYDHLLQPMCLITTLCRHEVEKLPQQAILDAQDELLDITGEVAFDPDSGMYALRCTGFNISSKLYDGLVFVRLQRDNLEIEIERPSAFSKLVQYEAAVSIRRRQVLFLGTNR